MAVSLGKHAQIGIERQAYRELEEIARKAGKAEGKRKKRAGIFGSLGGMALGKLIAMGLGVTTGGLALPLIMGLSASAATGMAQQATKGRWGKWLKTPGQVSGQVSSATGGKYGYAEKEAEQVTRALAESKEKSRITPGSILEDVALAYLTAGTSGGLKGTTEAVKTGGLKGLVSREGLGVTGKAGLFGKEVSGLKGLKYAFKGEKALADYLGGSIHGPLTEAETLTQSLAENPFVVTPKKQSYFQQILDPSKENRIFGIPLDSPNYSLPGQSDFASFFGEPITKEQGGLVPKYYGGGNVSEEDRNPTISDYFAMRGRTLGGSGLNSIAEILGRK